MVVSGSYQDEARSLTYTVDDLDGLIVSRAHELRQVDFSPSELVCIRCGVTGKISEMRDLPRCHPHLEKANSGWKAE